MLCPFALVLAVGAATAASAQSAGRLSVAVDGVRNERGSVRCGLYSSPDGFRDPGAKCAARWRTSRMDGRPACSTEFRPGTYAVAVFHAEHNEAQIETGLFGKPKQGYGFSNNPSSMFGPPNFSSAAFEYKAETSPCRCS